MQFVRNGMIGIDESGKGDYFGPLVVAAVYLPGERRAELVRMGARDSKEVSDAKAIELAASIRSSFPSEVVVVGPESYNRLYERMKNLNRLLAWGHARALENLLGRVECEVAVSDKFGDARLIEQALMEKGRKIRLVQRTHAEEETAVAAASLVARAEFLRRLGELSRRVGYSLPKGAGPKVDEAAERLVRAFGPEILAKVAKIHFKTTRKVIGLPPSSPS
jgi:ribonuclease HIII